MSTRDNFSPATKETLAKRVGWRCSNPDCCKLTIGPHEEATKSVNIGVAAHITAAASGVGAKRYDPNLSTEERKAITNGIWLCQNCGKLVDSDEQKYSVDLLVNWKREAEDRAASEVENVTPQFASNRSLQLMSYLQNLVDSPRICWLDEFVDLTGREFDLFTKVQKKSENPGTEEPNKLLTPLSTAIHDSDQRSILITGDAGAGKSTFLENLSIEAARQALTDPHAPIPVLVRLKDYDSSGEFSGIRGLVYSTLESYVNTEVVNQLLSDKKILLLIDGWNELLDEKAKSKIKKFCQSHTVIVTSRSAGDYWEIQQKFEIQPLSQTDVKKFFDKWLLNIERQRLQELLDRVRDFGQTPLIVWMLLIVFRDDNRIPKTRGEAYRCFTATYEKKAKGCADFDSSRKLLGKLAFEMMKSQDSEDSTEFRLNVSEVEAEEILGVEEFNRMLNHLLKQQGKMGIREISFCHQSIQEYYAAEHLRRELDLHPEWLERQDGDDYSWFQYHYLNYTKWTESIALLSGLPEVNQKLALKLTESALEVDLMLGARLAGEMRSDFQEKTVGMVQSSQLPNRINPPEWMKINLLGMTKANCAANILNEIIHNSGQNYDLPDRAVYELRNISPQISIPLLVECFKTGDKFIKNKAVSSLIELDVKTAVELVLSDNNTELRHFVVQRITEIYTKDSAIGIIRLISESNKNIKSLQPKEIKYIEGSGLRDLTVEDTAYEIEKNTISWGSHFIKEMPQDIYIAALRTCINDSDDNVKIAALELFKVLEKNQEVNSSSSSFYPSDIEEEDPQAEILKQQQLDFYRDRLTNSNPWIREDAVCHISEIKKEFSALQIMILLDDPIIDVASSIALEVTRLVRDSHMKKEDLRIVIPKLIDCFQGSDSFYRGYFADALGVLGKENERQVCEVLVNAFKDDEGVACTYEIAAIAGLQCHEAVPEMIKTSLSVTH